MYYNQDTYIKCKALCEKFNQWADEILDPRGKGLVQEEIAKAVDDDGRNFIVLSYSDVIDKIRADGFNTMYLMRRMMDSEVVDKLLQ